MKSGEHAIWDAQLALVRRAVLAAMFEQTHLGIRRFTEGVRRVGVSAAEAGQALLLANEALKRVEEP